MSARFDEIELLREPELPSQQQTPASIPTAYPPVLLPGVQPPEPTPIALPHNPRIRPASRFHRALAFLTDVSLFVALALALSPLLPYRADWKVTIAEEWPGVMAIGAFLLLLSYYYFMTGWLIWGKTVGGAIFDVRVVSEDGQPMNARSLSRRWAVMLLSILLGGGGFLPALLPGGRSLADRLSRTRSVVA